jgi:splicing factor 45
VRYEAPEDVVQSIQESREDESADEAMNAAAEDTGDPAQRSKAPGQKGFAQRMMQKYGWTKGSGLGAEGSGITTALKVKVEKSKKYTNEEGKVVSTGDRGKIVGGKRKATKKDEDSMGDMSSVVIVHGMLDGLDLDEEMGPNGNLVQEIGEQCGDQV